jgi:hypothetical protein
MARSIERFGERGTPSVIMEERNFEVIRPFYFPLTPP